MREKDIIDAYLKIRKIDNTIPDEVLDFMKKSAIEMINGLDGRGDLQEGFSQFKYMVLRGKEHGNVFWTSGGKYRTDWYELLFESDDAKEAQAQWEKFLFEAPDRQDKMIYAQQYK